MVDHELIGMDANASQARKVKAAAEQHGFFGDIRRAILLSRPNVADLASQIGVEPRVLRISKLAMRTFRRMGSTD